ncbi:hypothetical protein Hanom_Chr03g00208901 [Helianthus anomalus]
MKLSYHTVKETYEILKSKVTSLDNRLSACQKSNAFLEARFAGKQKVLNDYIDEASKFPQELAEKEKVVNKLQSYHASSYILERIFNVTPNDKDSKKNKKGIGPGYHQVPPPLEDNYTFYDGEKVEKAINMVDQLPDNIDESTRIDKSESQDENEGSFQEKYLKNSKSEKDANDDSKGMVYTMIGSDKLFSNVEFPIQNVISDKVDKVFKLIEIQKFEILKFARKSKKSSYN